MAGWRCWVQAGARGAAGAIGGMHWGRQASLRVCCSALIMGATSSQLPPASHPQVVTGSVHETCSRDSEKERYGLVEAQGIFQ